MIPFGRNPRFVGRQDEICKIEDLISMPDSAKKLAITGLGGVGKTQVALELAYCVRDTEPDCSIFWIACTSYEAVEQACMDIAQMVGIQDVVATKVKEHIKTYFSQINAKWLLIVDNADDMDMWTKGSKDSPPLKDFLPFNNQGHIIFTTRNRELAVDLVSSNVIHVRELDEKSGVEFVAKSLPKDLCHDPRAIITLLEQLTFLPLAISQATAYINKKGITVSDYLVLLKEQETEVVELLSKDFGDDGRYKETQNPVAKTWLISFNQIQKLDELAAEYLSLMACVDPRNIPTMFLPQPVSKLEMTDALGLLSAYSFITIQPGNSFISAHRLVHLATRNWMRKEGQFAAFIIKAADRLSEIFPDDNHTNRQLWREYLPHALSLFREREFHEQQEQYIGYMQNVGNCLYSDGRYDEAEKLLVKVMEICKQVLGLKHPDTLTTMANLASTYWKQGQWKEAEELEVQVIKFRKQVLGPEHPDTLTTTGNLALTYWKQGQWKEAEELWIQVIEIWKQVLGPEHPDTLSNMANLALIYWNQGKWKEAEELQVQVMKTRKQVLGPEHPETLTNMANLALTYWSQGRWKEAEELQAEELKLCSNILGPEHPDTLTSIANRASTYWKQGQWKEAEELEVQVMETRKQVLGLEHPDTLTSIANLALTYWDQGQWKESEQLQVQVMETRKQVLGPEHPDTLTSMANVAYTWKSLGNIQDALALMNKCVELSNKVLGSGHPDTMSSCNALTDWEAAQQTRQDPPALSHTRSPHQIDLDSKPVSGTKRQAFLKIFRKR